MELEEKFRNELNSVLLKEGFNLEVDESGYLFKKKYKLGEKVIFFEVSKKTKISFRVGLSVRVTNLPVQKIHSLVNTKNGEKSIISYRLSQLTKRYGDKDLNFERRKFNGTLGSVVSEESLSQYIINLKSCLRTLILPFFIEFNDQESFNKWLNEPIISGGYNFEIEPVWKDAINSLIISKLVCSSDFDKLYNVWIDQELPKGPGFDTREELIQLKEILSTGQLA